MKHSVFKLIYKVLIAFALALFFKILFFRLPEVIGFDLVFIAAIIFILWEGNKKIDTRLNAKYSWIENPKKRLLIQTTTLTLFTSISLFLLMFTLHQIRFGDGRLINRKMEEIFFPALFFALALISLYISYQFFKAWKHSLIEVEKYKTESANAQLQNLKSQLNPHFLFNNLSVLTSLVYKNQDKAADFINELSKVYRYALDNKGLELVSLQEELEFLKHYIYLLKIRFEGSLSFLININENNQTKYLPPMCLQMLVENTIQHNEASQAKPLQVTIFTMDNTLTIENKIQARSDQAESSKTGLKNLQARYSFFTDKKIEISNDEKVFKVTLPLMLQQ
jgi:two-component system LytT family sensor kinase